MKIARLRFVDGLPYAAIGKEVRQASSTVMRTCRVLLDGLGQIGIDTRSPAAVSEAVAVILRRCERRAA